MPRGRKPSKPVVETSVLASNILAVWNAASTADILEGKQWYDYALRFCQVLAAKYDMPLASCAGIVAALSPNNKWGRNKRDAEAMIAAYKLDMQMPKVCTFAANKAKALAILEGQHPLDVLKGNKVVAFYQCIMGDASAIVIDGHAWNIAYNVKQGLDAVPSMTDKQYQHVAAAYNSVANTLGVSAYQVQAVTWVVWRRQLEYDGYDM